ncbi:alpha/beta hydrolase [Labedaea rhizosphaerae]|uniref:alpha/beta hydrolase n=1 Tax=Labedaea rhizosphaerae TaxID=598644 RepID=UPI00105BC9B1|nr:alpha/beta hydrolase-fold protein [Labedaea rhizosphaerae]
MTKQQRGPRLIPRSLRAGAAGLGIGFVAALVVAFAIQVHEAKAPHAAGTHAPTTTSTNTTATTTRSAEHAPDATRPHDRVLTVSIPGAVSGFRARPAMIYLPPYYRTNAHARPPVLVLLAGRPGSPSDWFDGGALATVMDDYAAHHHGVAPVVVVPDDLGYGRSNPLCVDGTRGHVATYLDVDVVQWIQAHLHVDTDPAHWAIGGASDGGTCSLQTALRDPGRFPTLLDIAGSQEPLVGSESYTIDEVFGGDAAAFHAVNPLEELAARRYPHLAAVLTVSTEDTVYGPQQHRVAQALAADGVPVQFHTLPGKHGWVTFRPALEQALPWLAARMHLPG